MALELFFVSARTNKRHHHHHDSFSDGEIAIVIRSSKNKQAVSAGNFKVRTNVRHFRLFIYYFFSP